MNLEVVEKESKFFPVIYCDICRKQITDHRQANVVWDFSEELSEGKPVVPSVRCKNPCSSRKNGGDLWNDLGPWLVFLLYHVGIKTVADFKAIQKEAKWLNDF